jgi:Stress responsive A/B Barrel Domain
MIRLLSALLLLSLVTVSCKSTKVEPESETKMEHSVFFELHDKTPKASAELVAACYEYLADLPGVLSLTAGTRIEDLTGQVNVVDFDVALHVVFVDRAALDNYAEHERHLEFIADFRANWDSVRVFDALATRK